MREIKFRAWFKDKQEMSNVATNNIYEGNTSYMYLSPMPGSNYELVKIMQYTGLKDKNGKEIYEADIGWDEHHECYGVVKFDEGKFLYEWENISEDLFEVCDEIEIIGNIYENPELLEGDSDA